jgi:predicted dehydrogenase
MIEHNPIKIGIIGLGKMGQNHLRVLSMLKSVDIKFISDIDTKRASELGNKYDIPLSNILENDLKSIDAVVIVTPTSTHFDMLNLASKYVRYIFLEKPLTGDLESSKRAMHIIQERGINLQVGFIERFNPAIIELKKVIDHGGEVINIDFSRTNKLSSRITDVDVVADLMVHDIDLALYLNGPYRSVYAYGKTENGNIAFANAIITHENDRFSKLTASRITEKRIRQISVTCKEMYIDCDLLKKEVLVTKQTVDQSYRGIFLSSVEETIEVSNQEALLSEDMAFITAVAQDNFSSPLIPQTLDGINAMRLVDEVQRQVKGSV